MKKLIALITIVGLSSCTVTNNPDGTFTGAVDSASAIAIANQMFATK
jgi:hypothetical protein